jgi:1,2-dihydroxy-3-keto-5-methylthiopentene dioxygenase
MRHDIAKRRRKGFMTRLTVYAEHDSATALEVTEDIDRVIAVLAEIGVGFGRWQASFQLPPEADEALVIKAYQADVERLERKGGYRSKDVMRMRPDHPERSILRAKFLAEHIHDDDEVRFFVEGGGTFFLRDAGKVIELKCGRGDLINVPAGAKHWFDTGEKPFFTAIRLFTNPDGWQAHFTGDAIAERFVASSHPMPAS